MAKKTHTGRFFKIKEMSINPNNVASFETFKTESTSDVDSKGNPKLIDGIRLHGTFAVYNPTEFVYESDEKAAFKTDLETLNLVFHSADAPEE